MSAKNRRRRESYAQTTWRVAREERARKIKEQAAHKNDTLIVSDGKLVRLDARGEIVKEGNDGH